jgi:ketosteroid isomerase-like protein
MSDENTQLIRNAYASFQQGDIPGVIGILADRVDWDVTAVLPQGGSWRGRDGAGEFFEQLGSQWADLTIDVEQFVSDADHVVAIGRAAGRLREHGDAAAGYAFVHVFTVAGGAVTAFREWADPDEELREHTH